MKARHCLDCGPTYFQYDVLTENQQDWSHGWPYRVTAFHFQEYPAYVYYVPHTNRFEGIGPDVFPWEK